MRERERDEREREREREREMIDIKTRAHRKDKTDEDNTFSKVPKEKQYILGGDYGKVII